MWPNIIHHEPEWKRTIARDGRGDSICVYELEHGAGICGTSILYRDLYLQVGTNPHTALLGRNGNEFR